MYEQDINSQKTFKEVIGCSFCIHQKVCKAYNERKDARIIDTEHPYIHISFSCDEFKRW